MATSVSSVTSHFPDAENGFTTTTSGSVSAGDSTVGLNSVAGYTNGEPVVLVIDPDDATKKQTFTGLIDTAGVQITNVVWTAGTNVAHSAGATVIDTPTATHMAMLSKGIKVQHKQDGTHANTITTDTINENTSANGVTVDSLNIKDGKLNTNDSVVTANITDDAVTAAKMANGMVKHRQGSTTGDNSWYTAGTNNTDTSSKAVRIQTGVVTMASSATVTFPEAFNQVPVVFLTPVTAGTQNTFARASAISTTQFTGQCFINNTTGCTSESVAWLAIGQ